MLGAHRRVDPAHLGVDLALRALRLHRRLRVHLFRVADAMKIKTAKAAILARSRAPLVVDEIALPDELGVGQVLVKVFCTTICGAQLNEIEATKGPDKFLPHLLGHEGGGVVLKIGPGVQHIKEGDHVVLHWRKGQGIHCKPPKYSWDGRVVNSGWVTTFNEAALISENRLTPIPKSVPFDVAALMGC